MPYFIVERGPLNEGGTRQVHMRGAGPKAVLDNAVAEAKGFLAALPPEAVEAGFTIIVEDHMGNQVWGLEEV